MYTGRRFPRCLRSTSWFGLCQVCRCITTHVRKHPSSRASESGTVTGEPNESVVLAICEVRRLLAFHCAYKHHSRKLWKWRPVSIAGILQPMCARRICFRVRGYCTPDTTHLLTTCLSPLCAIDFLRVLLCLLKVVFFFPSGAVNGCVAPVRGGCEVLSVSLLLHTIGHNNNDDLKHSNAPARHHHLHHHLPPPLSTTTTTLTYWLGSSELGWCVYCTCYNVLTLVPSTRMRERESGKRNEYH